MDEAFWEEKTGREWPFGPLRFLSLFSAERFLGQGVAADISLSKIGLLSGLLGSLAEDWGVFLGRCVGDISPRENCHS